MQKSNYVFVHGGNHGGWCWQRLEEAMRERGCKHLLAVDIPGCGRKRERQEEGITLADVAEQLIEEVRGRGIERAVLVGHSMAGVILPYMAAQAPDLFSHRIYVSACVPRQGESIMDTMGTTLRGLDCRVVGYPVDPSSTAPLDLMRAMFAPGLADEDVDWLLAECPKDNWPLSLPTEALNVDGRKLDSPAAYIVTNQDPILPPCWQGRFAERAGAEVMISIDSAHEVFLSHPGELATTIEKAVTELGPFC